MAPEWFAISPFLRLIALNGGILAFEQGNLNQAFIYLVQRLGAILRYDVVKHRLRAQLDDSAYYWSEGNR